MNYEEKYNQAIESIKRIYEQADSFGKELMEKEFPELRESEDEKIRKGLIKGLSAMRDIHKHQTFSDDAINIDDAIAWLEKQGEQKYNYNESPSKEMILAVWELGNIWKELTKGSSCTEYGTQLQYIQKHWNESDYYEKLQGEQKPTDKVEPKFKVGDLIHNKWSNHSKEIVAVDDCQYTLNDGMPAPPIKVAIKEQDNWELVEQNPAWSEEDESMIEGINIAILDYYDKENADEIISWLKSIKDKVQPQSKQEWSEEDEEKIMWIVRLISTAGYRELETGKMPCGRIELIDWLKSLKPNHWKPSEYDISLLEEIARNIRNNVRPFCSEVSTLEDLIMNIKTL